MALGAKMPTFSHFERTIRVILIKRLRKYMAESPLKKDFEFYLAHQGEMVEKYNGKFVVIKDGEVVGAFDNELTAISEAQKKGHKAGTFLVQFVSPGDTAYKQTFHSRVVFS